ncbi:hypothetical protein HPB49_011026 [Dermacentor silvarum]|uniref:Uncharacterized protein n=1 Tax=Dermacentor silvarum TaxID=543639 RepID=A0ACB8C8V3_DERSI|nr:hypothetical protein HPB49_011026 [Dermacentor silvarum]
METEFEPDVRQEQEAQDLQPRLVNIDGRTAIAVQGEILPDDDIVGWETGARQPRQHKPTSHACFNGESTPAGKKHESRYTQAQYVKKVTANLTRMARMPTNIPREECKIIIRPRGGLNTGRTEAPTLTAAIWTAAGITKAEAMQDTVCANVAQNIIVVSTPDEQRARRYATIRSLTIGEQAHETYLRLLRGPARYFERSHPRDTEDGNYRRHQRKHYTSREPQSHRGTPHWRNDSDAASIVNTTKYAGRAAKSATGKTYARNQTRRFASLAVSLTQETRTPKNASHVESFVTAPTQPGRRAAATVSKFPPLKADRPLEERKRSASRSCLRGVQGGDSGRATSHGRESRSRSKRRTAQSARRESRSRERATWSEKVANHHRSKSRAPQIEDTMRALQQDNANLRAENQNLKAQVRELKQGQEEILRLLRAGQQPAGTTRRDIAQAAQRSLTPTPPPQQVPDQRSATPLIAERTPTTEPPSTAPQHETVEDMEEHTAEISRPSFKEHRAMNRERESTNARLNRHEKRIELLEKRLTALELRHPTNMDRNPTTRTRLRIWHWNANGFRCRKAVLQQHVASVGQPPDVIMIQETHMEDTPTLPGYRAYSSPPSAREHGKGAAQGVCTFVRKGLTSIHHGNFLGRSSIEHCVTEIGLGRRKQEPILLANIYSNPTHGQQKFKALLHKTTKTSPNGTVVVCGDFNAPHKELGYNRTSAKGRDLLEEASNAGFVLYTDPGNPTRIGTSTTRDMNPDLTFARLSGKARGTATWRNTGHNLGSDHYIIELNIPTTVHNDQKKFKHKLTDWTRFRATLDEADNDIEDIEKWTERVTKAADSVTAELDVEEEGRTRRDPGATASWRTLDPPA